jgi:hypothetical protein
MGAFSDAVEAYEAVLEVAPEHPAAFNALLCYYALGDPDAMRRGFLRLLQVRECDVLALLVRCIRCS